MPRALLVSIVAAMLGCGTPFTPPAPPTGVAAITVAAVENKTRDQLVISGDTFVEKWIGRTRRTVPDAIGRELESELRDQGFAVGGAGTPRLSVVLRRFDPDLPQLAYVNVALTATLADPDGTVKWTLEREHWIVSTSQSPSISDAYETASRTVARGIVKGWQPAH
jgi:hypothetical protein